MTVDAKDIKGVSPWLQSNWDARAACNFIGGGTGTGLLAVAALLGLSPIPLFALAGMAFVGFGLFCVWLEIGRPWRAINVFFHPQTSWMTREGIVAMPLFVLCAVAFVADSFPALASAALVGLFYLYCQARIVQASKGVPAWRHPAIMPALVAMGLAEGAGIALVLSPKDGGVLFILLVALRFALWRRYLKRFSADGAPVGALKVFSDSLFVFMVTGHALPVLFVGAGLWLDNGLVIGLSGVLVAGSGWWMKLLLITKAADNQGFVLPRVPVRGQGKAGDSYKPGWLARDRLTPGDDGDLGLNVNRSPIRIDRADSRLHDKPNSGFSLRRPAP